MIPFPANSAEFEEFLAVTGEIAREIHDSTPDPEPEDFGGRCEDAPCCGCCGHDSEPDHEDYVNPFFDENREDYSEDAPDDSHLDKNWEDCDDEGGEDSYLDTYWEDQAEYGMEGCCGDF
jgi:hypothetical protein